MNSPAIVKRPLAIVFGLLVLSAAVSRPSPVKVVLVGDSTVATGGGWGAHSRNVEVVRRIAAEKGVPGVDLYARSLEQLEKIGAAAAQEYDPPTTDPAVADTTHLSPTGAVATARLVAAKVSAIIPSFSSHLTETP